MEESFNLPFDFDVQHVIHSEERISKGFSGYQRVYMKKVNFMELIYFINSINNKYAKETLPTKGSHNSSKILINSNSSFPANTFKCRWNVNFNIKQHFCFQCQTGLLKEITIKIKESVKKDLKKMNQLSSKQDLSNYTEMHVVFREQQSQTVNLTIIPNNIIASSLLNTLCSFQNDGQKD